MRERLNDLLKYIEMMVKLKTPVTYERHENCLRKCESRKTGLDKIK